MNKKTILLTGATGTMGREGLSQLHSNKNLYQIVVFSLPTKSDQKFLRKYRNDDAVTILWGDLTNAADVKKAVRQVDMVLHVGALVSPAADKNPEQAWKTNFEGTKNIVDAIRACDNCDSIKLVYIGTVAETGNRPAPFHWGRVGDPVLPSPYDHYALSKAAAERYVIESGLKYWVSLRQTGILHSNIFKMNDGIGYHQPLNNHMEWITAHDAGLILLNICSEKVSKDFWNQVYNIGGGPTCRLTALEFYNKLYHMFGVDIREFENPNWYALRNFHGQWYLDSDVLEAHLHFRTESIEQAMRKIKNKCPPALRLMRYLPKKFLKQKIMLPMATTENCPLHWMEHNMEGKINAFFGSKEKWEKIPDWDDLKYVFDPPYQILNHGYDESKTDDELTLQDMIQAAGFRGGECLSKQMTPGDMTTKLNWQCAEGHKFEVSPYLVLKTGHWCTACIQPPWRYDQLARSNPFIAQIWYADHEKNENNVYQ